MGRVEPGYQGGDRSDTIITFHIFIMSPDHSAGGLNGANLSVCLWITLTFSSVFFWAKV